MLLPDEQGLVTPLESKLAFPENGDRADEFLSRALWPGAARPAHCSRLEAALWRSANTGRRGAGCGPGTCPAW
jgi:hypothetical protein